MEMDQYLLKRIGSAKVIGMTFGLIAFFLIPSFLPEVGLKLRFGVMMWYTTVGAVIGIMGLIDHHPLLKFRLTFWFRGLFIGVWFNLVLVFLMYDKLSLLMQQLDGAFGGVTSPFWLVLEGAVIGLLIDAGATKFAGEGMPEQGGLSD